MIEAVVVVLVFLAVLMLAGLLPKPWKKSCAREGCTSTRDPRCAGLNCTFHCSAVICCNARCLDVWKKQEMENDALRRAIAEEMGH